MHSLPSWSTVCSTQRPLLLRHGPAASPAAAAGVETCFTVEQTVRPPLQQTPAAPAAGMLRPSATADTSSTLPSCSSCSSSMQPQPQRPAAHATATLSNSSPAATANSSCGPRQRDTHPILQTWRACREVQAACRSTTSGQAEAATTTLTTTQSRRPSAPACCRAPACCAACWC